MTRSSFCDGYFYALVYSRVEKEKWSREREREPVKFCLKLGKVARTKYSKFYTLVLRKKFCLSVKNCLQKILNKIAQEKFSRVLTRPHEKSNLCIKKNDN